MKMTKMIMVLLMFTYLTGSAQDIVPPVQPVEGPGGANYLHDSLVIHDFAQRQDGYWLFEPAAPRPDSVHVVIFLHGYGAINPMIYGKWIEHLVRKGNLVIYPRYQRNVFRPSSKKFVPNVVKAIQTAFAQLDTGDFVRPIMTDLAIVGHSYGGAIAANLAANATKYDLPAPAAVLLCSPGTGPFKGGVLKSYDAIPEEVKLLVMVSDRDKTVGDKLGKTVFTTATQVKDKHLIRQHEDDYGYPPVRAGHNESYSLDSLLDCGIYNLSSKRACRTTSFNAVDYFGYWKLLDGLLNCVREGRDCEYALGGTSQQAYMGEWSDGRAVRPLEIE